MHFCYAIKVWLSGVRTDSNYYFIKAKEGSSKLKPRQERREVPPLWMYFLQAWYLSLRNCSSSLSESEESWSASQVYILLPRNLLRLFLTSIILISSYFLTIIFYISFPSFMYYYTLLNTCLYFSISYIPYSLSLGRYSSSELSEILSIVIKKK